MRKIGLFVIATIMILMAAFSAYADQLAPTGLDTLALGQGGYSTAWWVVFDNNTSDINDLFSRIEDAWNSPGAADDNDYLRYKNAAGKWQKTALLGTASQITVTNNVYSTVFSLDSAITSGTVTNGNSHDHVGGDGAQIDHGGLAGLGDNDHTQYVLKSGSLTQITTRSHTDLTDIGSNTHAQIDTHIASAAPHSGHAPTSKGVTNGDTHDHSGGDGAQINHTTLSNIGTTSHTDIDTHIASNSAHHVKTTTFAELTDTALDSQIPNDITIDILNTHIASATPHTGYPLKGTLTAKGSIYAASAASTITEVTVGSDGKYLYADSGQSGGLNYKYFNDVYRWDIADTPLTTGTEQGGVWIAPQTMTIVKAYIYCKTTGTVSGATTVDVNKNGVTVFTTQGNRPSLAYNDGDKKDVSGAPDVTSLAEGDIISIDIDAIPGGADSAKLSLILICR